MAETINTNQFKNGMHIELDGQPWRIVEFQHVKPGKGGAFVRTKLKGLGSGAVVDRTFRAGEKFSRVHTEVKNVQYLYDDGSEVHFMDSETYEQFALPHGDLEEELPFMQPNATVQVLAVDGKPSNVLLPAGSKYFWRSSTLPPLERWWFAAAATLLTVVGALVDGLGGS